MAKKQRSRRKTKPQPDRRTRQPPPSEQSSNKRLDLLGYLPFRIGTLSQRLLREASPIYKRASVPLTAPQWMVLFISATFEPLSASEISRISLIDEVGVSRAVANLERLGLITRTKPSQDQRLLEISVTEAGWVLYEELADKMKAQDATLRSALTPDEVRMLLGLIDRLDAAANAMAELRHSHGEATGLGAAVLSTHEASSEPDEMSIVRKRASPAMRTLTERQ